MTDGKENFAERLNEQEQLRQQVLHNKNIYVVTRRRRKKAKSQRNQLTKRNHSKEGARERDKKRGGEKEKDVEQVSDRQVVGEYERIDVLEAVELVLLDARQRVGRVGREYDGLAREQLVDVVQVALGLHGRLVGRLYEALLEHVPVDGLEEQVLLDLGEAVVRGEPFAGRLLQEALEHRGGAHAQITRYAYGLLEYHLEQVVLGVEVRIVAGILVDGLEGRAAGHHLEHEDAEGPPVDAEVVVLAAQHLGRDVVGRAAEGARAFAARQALLAHAVVGELDVAVDVEQHVVELQVAIDDAARVQEAERHADLGRVEARVVLGQATLALHVVHQVAAAQVLDDEEEARLGLKARVQADQERVVRGLLEHVLLRLHPVDVLVVVHNGLLDHLHGVALLGALVLGQEDLGVRAAADHLDQVELLEAHLATTAAVRRAAGCRCRLVRGGGHFLLGRAWRRRSRLVCGCGATSGDSGSRRRSTERTLLLLLSDRLGGRLVAGERDGRRGGRRLDLIGTLGRLFDSGCCLLGRLAQLLLSGRGWCRVLALLLLLLVLLLLLLLLLRWL